MKRFNTGVLFLIAGAISVAFASDGLAQSGPYQYYAIPPCRFLDTRNTNPPVLTNFGSRAVNLIGKCGVPSGAAAATLNVTITTPTNPGYLILYPYGIPQPLVSTINFTTGDTLANGAIVPLTAGPTNNLTVYSELYGGGTVHLVLDVTGYFAP
jgi:hypothetical protein